MILIVDEPQFDVAGAASAIVRLHAKMERLAIRSIEVQVEGFATAAQIGNYLLRAQRALKGGYQKWVERNYKRFKFGLRQARRYKVVARVVADAGGLEEAIADPENLRAMQAALGYKLAELGDSEGGEGEDHPRLFEQFRIPADPGAVPLEQRPVVLEKARAFMERLRVLCDALSGTPAVS